VILVDTHALVWAVADSRRLSRAAATAIRKARADDGVAIAAITLWELAALVERGRIQAYGSVEASVRLLVEGVTIIPVTVEIAAMAAQFSADYSRDPADRLIGATAKALGLALITRDEHIRRSAQVETIW
jgi:PIN domain nuclease of toxin-antitoxin system